MRPAQLFTLSAVVGLTTICYGNLAQAAPITYAGSVTPSCTIDSVTDGNLNEDISNIPAVALVATGNDRGVVKVKCNTTTNKLNLAINTVSTKVYNGTAKIRFNGLASTWGTTGTNINLPIGVPSSSPIQVLLPAPTRAIGDTGYIQVRVDAPPGKLLQAANDYLVVVDATIVP